MGTYPEGTITRRLEAAFDALSDEFKAMYRTGDFRWKLEELQRAPQSRKPEIYNELYTMFEQCGISCERNRERGYYERLLKDCNFPLDTPDLEKRMLLALYARYRDYPAPENYLQKIVEKVSDPTDGWLSDPLRLKILKRFIRYGDCLSGYLLSVKKKGGKKENVYFGGRSALQNYVKKKTGRTKALTNEEIVSSIDDGVFGLLENAKKSDTTPNGPYALLKLADDLASGQFRAGGGTKRNLYLFAIVYDMTYYSGAADKGEILRYESDIEEQLFRRYYNNNLVRYLMDAYQKKRTAFEADPSGQGINYKNFMEMIFLYFISTSLPAKDKIARASQMIWDVQQAQKGEPFKAPGRDEGETVFYRNLYSEDILDMTEEEFRRFIVKNYRCTSSAGLGAIQLGREQNTAFRFYRELIDRIRKQNMLEISNYGLWFADVAGFRRDEQSRKRDGQAEPEEEPKPRPRPLPDGIPESERARYEDFITLLKAANHFLGSEIKENASKQEAKENNDNPEEKQREWTGLSKARVRLLYLNDPSEMTRTALIVAWYYCYNAEHEFDEMRKPFEELFADFQAGLNPRLQAAGYQPFSGRNLFDVYVAFSSYAYLSI